ncbi:MAG: hypothetical protein AAF160_10440 [Pseudomonadota bacterium]
MAIGRYTLMIWLALGSVAAGGERLALPDGGVIPVRDSGLIQLSLLRLAFGLEIEPVVERAGAEPRPVTDDDLLLACRNVLATDGVRLGNTLPEYVFFAVSKREVGFSFLRLTRSEKTWFTTRGGNCRPTREPLEHYK